LVHIIADIKQQLYKDKVDAFNLNWLDISNVTMLDQLFNVSTFNRQYIFWNVSDWDTSHVTSMVGTFNGCKDICDLSKWDTSKVTSMVNMFYECSTFNSNISNWNVSKVTRFDSMFYGCSSFN
jgi:surface protein